MSAARTNLTSYDVRIGGHEIGHGQFRVCLEGTFIGGTRNNQDAVCKRFKPQYRAMEKEFFSKDFMVIDKTIEIASAWNLICPPGKEIMVNRGSIHCSSRGIKYLVEPMIRYFQKFTSNSGWIGPEDDWEVRCMEAFTHYSYAYTGGQLIVCDLQGRYKFNRYSKTKSRFELTDPAICSRSRKYGPTDLGEKGIDSFFANHQCNEFCEGHWARPRYARQWFPLSEGTSMVSSQLSHQLKLTSNARFIGNGGGLGDILEDYDSDEEGW